MITVKGNMTFEDYRCICHQLMASELGWADFIAEDEVTIYL